MKLLVSIILINLGTFSFSQEKIQLVTGFSSSFSKEVYSNAASLVYGEIGFDLGIKLLNKKSGELNLSIAYQFSSNVIGYNHEGSISEDNPYLSYNSRLRSHFLGGALKYAFLKQDKIIRPYIEAKLLTEIGTNYKNGLLLEDEYIPKDKTWGTGQFPTPFYSTLYHSTPFVGSVVLGGDFRLIENLHLNLGIGYGFRIMKIKDASWYENEDLNEVAQDKPTKNIRSHMVDVQLGLTYTFSLKKKPENTKN